MPNFIPAVIRAPFLRQRRRMCWIWVGVTTVGTAWAWLTPNVFQSTGKLFVRLGRENVTLDPTANLGQGSISIVPQIREQEINTVVETLRSRVLIEHVVDELTPETIIADQQSLLAAVLPQPERPREYAIEKLSASCEMTAVRKSNLISVTCEARDPELARKVTEAIIDRFFVYHRGLNRNPGAGRFFAQQAELLGDKLKQSEADLLQLKNRMGVVDISDQKRLLLAQCDAVQQDLDTTDAQAQQAAAAICALESQRDSLPEQLAMERTDGHANTASDSMRDRLFALEVRESELAARMTDAHFLLQEAHEQVAAARVIQQREKESRSQSKHGRNPTYEQVLSSLLSKQAEQAALHARAESRRAHLEKARADLATLNDAESQLAQLERELELRRVSYDKYCQSLEQTRIDEALEAGRISNISVAEPPTVSHKPVRPNRSLIVALSLICATVAAVGIGLLADQAGHAPSTELPSTPAREQRTAGPRSQSLPENGRTIH